MLYLFDICVISLFDSSIDVLYAFIGVSSVIVYIMCDVSSFALVCSIPPPSLRSKSCKKELMPWELVRLRSHCGHRREQVN
jgi:hypothetical protein